MFHISINHGPGPGPQTLLDLGASPDYKDSRGLTPLYHSAMVGGAPYCCELLLQDHATIGMEDRRVKAGVVVPKATFTNTPCGFTNTPCGC